MKKPKERLTTRQYRFLRHVTGLRLNRREMDEILNADPDTVFDVEFVTRPAPWYYKPEAPKPKKGWPKGVRRSYEDRLRMKLIKTL